MTPFVAGLTLTRLAVFVDEIRGVRHEAPSRRMGALGRIWAATDVRTHVRR